MRQLNVLCTQSVLKYISLIWYRKHPGQRKHEIQKVQNTGLPKILRVLRYSIYLRALMSAPVKEMQRDA